jgi:hypothetical protein
MVGRILRKPYLYKALPLRWGDRNSVLETIHLSPHRRNALILPPVDVVAGEPFRELPALRLCTVTGMKTDEPVNGLVRYGDVSSPHGIVAEGV